MGDGVEPIAKGFVGTIISGIVGIVHGVLDSYNKYAPVTHDLLSYGPVAGTALYTASSKYGLWTPQSRVGAAVISGGFAAGAAGAGYVVGRVVGAGIESLLQ
jgi:hypothetical protein